MMVVDASVWVALLDPSDALHRSSLKFGEHLQQHNLHFYAPAIVIVETGCAVARRTRDAAKGAAVAKVLREIRALHLIEEDEDFLLLALRLGTQQMLRGTDALYLAAASATGSALVSWDRELIERGGAKTPSDWLTLHS